MSPVDILKTTAVDKIPSDLDGMEASMERLLALIDDVYKYVDNVVVRSCWFSFPTSPTFDLIIDVMICFSFQEGNIAPDNNIGRYIADTLASVPKLSPTAFDKLVNDSLQVRNDCFICWNLLFDPVNSYTSLVLSHVLSYMHSLLPYQLPLDMAILVLLKASPMQCQTKVPTQKFWHLVWKTTLECSATLGAWY